MKVDLNVFNGTVEHFPIILSTRDHRHLGEIVNVSKLKFTDNLGSAKTLSFEVDKFVGGVKERLWDEIVNFKFVYIRELNTYFEIYIEIDEEDSNKKEITAESACECELSQSYLYNIEINTEEDIMRLDYEPAVFYNPDNTKASLLHRILEKVPAYTIKYVDESLRNILRSFSVNEKTVYDFLMNECATEFNCLFIFDSADRSISVYDLYTTCKDCGYRGDYTDSCPNCNSNNLKYYGTDTSILVSTDNLTDKVTLEINTDNIKNCYKLEAGDDTMTAAAMTYIPSGGDRIWNFSEEQFKDLPPELSEKIISYNKLYDSKTADYHALMERIYECIERITYYTSKQMPDITIPDTTAKSEASKLTAENLSPVSLSLLTSYTSLETVNSAIVNYAKVYVRSGFVRIEVDSGSFKYSGTLNGINVGVWTGRLKITNYSNKDDIAYSDTLSLTVNDDYMSFMNEKILKNISESNNEDGSVYDVLNIDNLTSFSSALTLYGLNRLISFRDAINGVLAVLIEANGGTESSELYTPFYKQYYDKLLACNEEIKIRKLQIENLQEQQELYDSQRIEIQDALNLKKYLGDELYRVFTTYIREDKYKNENYISDGLSNEKIFERAQEFLAKAHEELVKSSHYQHTIQADMHNLLLMEEFTPIANNFELGNWIRVKIDDNIYRLRLISYQIDFDNLNSLNTEFSDVTKTSNGLNDIYGVLKNTKPIISTYNEIVKDATDGKTASDTLDKYKEDGIDCPVNPSENGEITIDKNGITGRDHDDINDEYSPEQIKITKNVIAFTTDYWKTVKMSLGKTKITIDGKTTEEYGVNADFCISSKIVAGNIYSYDYSSTANKGTRLNLDDGTFTLAGGKIVFDGKKLKISGVEIDWSTTNESTEMWASINANANGITTEVARAKGTEAELSSRITQTATEIRTEVKDVKEELTSSITQTATEIRTEVNDVNENLMSSITQTAAGIMTEVENVENNLKSSIVQTESKIRADVASNYETKEDAASTYGSIRSSLSIESDRISAEIERAEKAEINLNGIITTTERTLSSKIESTERSINLSVNQKLKSYSTTTDMNSAIKLEVDKITSTVSETYETKSDAGAKYEYFESSISQTKDSIKLKVSANDIISTINQSAEEISIDASKINLNGTVTANKAFIIDTNGTAHMNNGCTIGPFNISNSDLTAYGSDGSYTTIGISPSRYPLSTGLGGTRHFFVDGSGYIFTDNNIDAKGYVAGSNLVARAYGSSGSGNLNAVNIGASGGGGYVDVYYQGVFRGDIRGFSDALEVSSNKDLALHAGNSGNFIHLYNNTQYYGTFAAASSRKYKENITEISIKDADKVSELVPVEFDYIETGMHSCGLIAEDAYKLFPQIVGLKNGEPDNIDYIRLIPYLLKKIQNLEKRILALKPST